ncbi:MAG: Asp-tRNA(Asn)/Glu-tRNA(Gln) amidotransferase subunit GatC [Syntrophomonadales bacterium]|jgi:aspartyl-tRNA(Asn)/glutamyl-tRNA(Gln) amidotransferase subunit C
MATCTLKICGLQLSPIEGLFQEISGNTISLSDIILCMKIWESEERPLALLDKDIERLAVLARINLTSEEKEIFTQQLNSVLDSVEVLNELPTNEVEPLIYVLPLYNVMRDDEVHPSLPIDEAMDNAPLQEEAKFKVPRLI